MKAVIPAAGLGSRFLPYTKAQPKEMLPIVDKPAIKYVVEEAVESGLCDILVITGRGKRSIERHFDANPELDRHLERLGRSDALDELEGLMRKARILFARQPVPRGLGDAVLTAESYVGDEPFAVLLGDDITLEPPCARVLVDAHRRIGRTVVALQRVSREEIGRYGMIVGKELDQGLIAVEDLTEKPASGEIRSDLATIGRYILTPAIFACLRETGAGKGGEVQLTDAIKKLLTREEVYGVLYEGRRFDVGNKPGWLAANLELALRRTDLRDELRSVIQQLGKA